MKRKIAATLLSMAIAASSLAVCMSAGAVDPVTVTAVNVQVRADHTDWGNFVKINLNHPIHPRGEDVAAELNKNEVVHIEQLADNEEYGSKYTEICNSLKTGITFIKGEETKTLGELGADANLISGSPDWGWAAKTGADIRFYLPGSYDVHGNQDFTIRFAAGTKTFIDGVTFDDFAVKYDGTLKTWSLDPIQETEPTHFLAQTDGEIDLLTIRVENEAPMHFSNDLKIGDDGNVAAPNQGAYEKVEEKTSADGPAWNQKVINGLKQGIILGGKTFEEWAEEAETTVEDLIDVTFNSYNDKIDIQINDADLIDFYQPGFEVEFTNDFYLYTSKYYRNTIFTYDDEAGEYQKGVAAGSITADEIEAIQADTIELEVTQNGGKLSAEVMAAIKESGKPVVVKCIDMYRKPIATFAFDGSKLTSTDALDLSYNTTIDNVAINGELDEILNGHEAAIRLNFGQAGAFPEDIKFTLRSTGENFAENSYYLYKYMGSTKVSLVKANVEKADNMFVLALAEGGQYVLTTKQIDSQFIYSTSNGEEENNDKDPSKEDEKKEDGQKEDVPTSGVPALPVTILLLTVVSGFALILTKKSRRNNA